jgi:hypothetical protein
MYSADQIRKIQKLTTGLLKKLPLMDAADIDSLRECLRFHEYRYYVLTIR